MTYCEIRDVDSPGGDVGRHHEGDLAPLHLAHHPFPFLLGKVAVEQLGVEAVPVQDRGDQRGVVPGVAEDDGVVRLLHLQQVDQVPGLRVGVGHVVADVVDVVDGEDVPGEHQHLRRGGVLADEVLDLRRHRGAEEQDLPVLRELVEDPGDLLVEPLVQHLVGLVEDDVPTALELEVLPADVVVDPAGRADHDRRATLQRVLLLLHRRAAVDGRDPDALVLGQVLDLGGHLERQLAGGAEDQRTDGLVLGVHLLQQGEPERGGLPRPGLAPDDEVLALHHRVEGLGLHRGGAGVAAVGEGAADLRGERQVLEADVGQVLGRSLGGGRLGRLGARRAPGRSRVGRHRNFAAVRRGRVVTHRERA